MKLKDNLNIRKVGDTYMIVTESEAGLDYTRVISLNRSAVYLIENSIHNKNFSPVDWVNLLMDRYDVSHETVADDVQALLEVLIKAGVVEK